MKARDNKQRKTWSDRQRRLSGVFALLALIFLLAAGCGGSSSSSAGSTTAESSSAFLQKGSTTNKIVEFGSEAPVAVRTKASDALTENLEAREEAHFAAQCATLAKEQVEQVSHAKGSKAAKICPKELRKIAEPLSTSKPIRANQLTGPIAALRVQGDKAYALFHGKDKDDYAMPMLREGAEWKVAAIVLTKLGTSK
jgi:hypothetical protein